MLKAAVACLGLLLVSAASLAAELRAGAARVDITPPVGYPMWGYASRHDAPSQGIHDPLYARALVLAVGAERLALVALDLGRAPTRDSMTTIRKRMKDVGISHIFLVASHTHHGPVVELAGWPTPQKPYVRHLEQKIIEVILKAQQALQPARLGVASKEVPLNRNRHSKLPDKPVDRELLLLRVEDNRGHAIAHAVNFAAHPTMQDAKVRQISADYPGILAALVEKETGVPCLFLQGHAGDLSANPGNAQGVEQFGQCLGREVLILVNLVRCRTLPGVTLTGCEEDFQFQSRVDLSKPVVKLAYVAAFFQDLVDFYEREYRMGVRPHLSVTLLDGRIGFVGVSGEFFCSHALHLKQRARLEHLFFLGYCNDYQQYFPTIEAVAEGGYGASALVAPVEVGAGERIMDRALIHLFQMRGRLDHTSRRVQP